MMKLALLMAGGSIGTLARYGISILMGFSNTTFPWSTFFVNLAGSLIMGLLAGLYMNNPMHPNFRAFAMIGFLGGFTTFSTFSLESLNLFHDGNIGLGFTYIMLSNLLGLGLVLTGFLVGRRFA